jgi:hypothetical protein
MHRRVLCFAVCLVPLLSGAPAHGAVTVQVSTGTILSLQFGAGLAPPDCPAGSTALGGGVDNENPNKVSVVAIQQDDQTNLAPGSHPAIEAWSGFFANADAVSHSIAVASLCMDGQRDVEVDAISADPHSVGAARIQCPGGAAAVGGGVTFAPNHFVTSSGPILDDGTPNGARLIDYGSGTAPAPIGWRSTLRNDGDAGTSERASAVCETRLHGLATQIGPVTVPASDTGSDRVLCPAGQIAYGGGVDSSDTSSLVVTASAPIFDDGTPNGQRLINRSDGLDSAPIGWFGAARNEDTLVAHTLMIGVICPEPAEDGMAVVAFGTLAAIRRRSRD